MTPLSRSTKVVVSWASSITGVEGRGSAPLHRQLKVIASCRLTRSWDVVCMGCAM